MARRVVRAELSMNESFDLPPAAREAWYLRVLSLAGVVQALAGIAFLVGVASWSHNQFAWPRWLILVGLLGLYAAAAVARRYNRRRLGSPRPLV
jgi:peptidoglycan/LPS O-acetylase OafA/YrhL